MALFSVAKSVQPTYNPKPSYLPILKKTKLHKLLFIKELGCGKKIAIVFNDHRQLISDINRYIVTWMPHRKLLLSATKIADYFLKLPALEFLSFAVITGSPPGCKCGCHQLGRKRKYQGYNFYQHQCIDHY
jgi:hypothetical protein